MVKYPAGGQLIWAARVLGCLFACDPVVQSIKSISHPRAGRLFVTEPEVVSVLRGRETAQRDDTDERLWRHHRRLRFVMVAEIVLTILATLFLATLFMLA